MLIARTARRASVVAGLFLALIVGTTVPASAAFSASSAVSTAITTVAVVAPDPVTLTGRCNGSNYNATVSWTASTSANVTGYRVVMYFNNGFTSVLGTTNAATLSLAFSRSNSTLSLYQPTVTVTTLTSYGWTAESAHTAVLTC